MCLAGALSVTGESEISEDKSERASRKLVADAVGIVAGLGVNNVGLSAGIPVVDADARHEHDAYRGCRRGADCLGRGQAWSQ